MKKLLLLLALFILPLNISALSLSDIEQSDKYVQVDSKNNVISYLDLNNTEKVSETKDLAMIKTKLIGVDFNDYTIMTANIIYTYKKDRKTSELKEFINQMDEPETKANPTYFLTQLKLLDSGVTATKSEHAVFDFSGKLLDSDSPQNIRTVATDVRSKDYAFASFLYKITFGQFY